METFITIDAKELKIFMAKMGQRGEQFLEIFKKDHASISAFMQNPLGRAILHDDLERLFFLSDKLYQNGLLESNEREEFKYLRARVERLKAQVVNYIDSIEKIKKVGREAA